ncbi:Phosphatidylglycerol/phosphatidylinositol transfer protein [Apophysomyces ossiformis]|uniref:Phosphatidylglycerol/phosphatidylinositol transfer protein n=1 Tax=Apophysomyces ossiformis TaxID=679940 RepID=A0A8H7BQF9_9FUNG|nr:Phosphatidylglycerol/phosphatidylinositol transfer protein [Apophysomyces ossiformis]
MAPDQRGAIWSLCSDPSTHLLRGYDGGVYISPEAPQTGKDIHVKVGGYLSKDVHAGTVDIDLKLLSMIKINKQLDLCSVLQSDVMGHRSCPLAAGDIELEATAFIPRDIPKLPLNGDIRIKDQDGNTVTCISLNFKLQ